MMMMLMTSLTLSNGTPLSLATSFLVFVVINPILRAMASAVRGWSPAHTHTHTHTHTDRQTDGCQDDCCA